MNTIGERIRHLRKSHNVTMKKLSQETGINQGGLSSYENNKFKPSAEAVVLISNFFKISTDWILKGEILDIQYKASPQEEQLLESFRLLNSENKSRIEGMLELKIYEQQEDNKVCYINRNTDLSFVAEETEPWGSKVKVLGEVAAGEPIEVINTIDDLIEISGSHNVDFALTVKGKSMEPNIKDGSTILIKQQDQLDSGDVGVISIDGEVTCKKIMMYDSYLELRSFNDEFKVRTIKKEDFEQQDIRILGKVIWENNGNHKG